MISSSQSRARRRHFLAAACAAFVSLCTASCTVTESVQISPVVDPLRQGTACASDLGSYALPKSFLRVRVGQTGDKAPDIIVKEQNDLSVETVRHPDPSLVFCLDYLASPMAHDKITIRKSVKPGGAVPDSKLTLGSPGWLPVEKTPFLGAVMVNASDRTNYIIDTLLRAAFIIASGDPAFAPRKTVFADTMKMLADLEYDPFDPEESAAVNARLSKLGFCLVLGDYTFPRRKLSVDGYCNAPHRRAEPANTVVEAYLKAKSDPADRHMPGLLYRPRAHYRLEIYRKADPGGRGSWQIAETIPVQLENLSPVLSLDIRRAAFAGRNANFVFEHGSLVTACISKGSEVEGFVDIPLSISRSILALPGAIIKIRIDQTSHEAKLVKAEQELMQVQSAYMQALASGKYQQQTVGQDATFTPSNFVPGEPTAAEVAAGEYAAPDYDANNQFDQSLVTLCKGSS